MRLPFDVDHPPANPPRGCRDLLLWRISWALHRAHRRGPYTGACLCGLRWPCWGSQLAVRGLIRACHPQDRPHWVSLLHPD